ncbi:hypothetical protein DNU06_12395 [Putridiphycobacter roseus]|uniref:Secretion system C-terminal sorting domain-containing protein n=1 Tax=Putridiphycobacter roseus TaxID=2219161 RepID=A0A2W1NPU3_9FLAO|nr:GDSL-type esterase/lipase family protein [Putridiphycobacter roseus]PZE16648.1 hypothetical protein DNU06_12395 [Putridiphycobacter roseus]
MIKYLSYFFFVHFFIFVGHSQNNPCAQLESYKIVVLGSSTAAGAGVSNSDSAWVNRYRNYLESINPNNEVVNLAVGGYNTYKIMPTGFIQPAGRPSPDVNKNITAALALNPDAIIVNMPSNDVAGGYNYAEQMYNLDSIFQLSNLNNVPIWICTTQPRNFSDTNKLNLQYELKDSITSIFDPFTIDFWTGFALADHTIDPVYNSGDGVHINDTAHAVLLARVKLANILDYLYSASSTVDYSVNSFIHEFVSNCGDSSDYIQVVIANHGILDTLNGILNLSVQHLNTGLTNTQTLPIMPIAACAIDTFNFYINTFQAGNYHVFANSVAFNDTTIGNDTLSLFISTTGRPSPLLLLDTLCDPGMGLLAVPAILGDSVQWYQNSSANTAIHSGNVFQTPFISASQTWYVESVRGPLFYGGNLGTTQTSNINFNGAMLNMMPNADLILDSVGLKILNTGQESVDIYYKLGSYLGHENNASSWTLLTTSTAMVTDSLALTYFKLPTFNAMANDTIGFYFQMTNANSKLGYLSMSSSKTRSNAQLSIFTGSGISYNFTNNYFPRDLNCDFRYSYANTSYGTCNSGKYPATVYVSDYEFSLGNDTIIDILDSITFNVPSHLNNWYWQDGSTDDILTIAAADLGVGIHYVTLTGEDSLGCTASDELIVGVANLVGLSKTVATTIQLFPNPATNWINIKTAAEIERIDLIGIDGKMIRSNITIPADISALPEGNYFIKIKSSNETTTIPFIKN